MELNTNHWIGACLIGIAVFMGLGILGYGGDTVAIWFAEIGIDAIWSRVLSKGCFGLAAAGAIFFLILGSTDVSISSERVSQAINDSNSRIDA